GLTSLELAGDPGGRHTAYEYDRSGLLTSMSTPESSEVAYGYDAAGRLASIATTMPSGVLAYSYERDAVGNITAENGTRYSYDELNRLMSWYDPGTDATTAYSYDANYNLTSAVRDGQTERSFTFDAADRISSPGYVYDDAGNMTAGGESGYAYDGANRLVSVADASTEETIATYAYDHLNRRISATEGTSTVYFHYDGASPNVIAETGDTGDTIASYVYDAAGRLHSMMRDGETYYYHANAHGDVVALTDETGEAVNEYSYDPWGASTGATETVANPYRYASYRFDEATGLYYCWNRYYDTGTCRWITKDLYPGEAANPGTMNGYAYCLGNPVAWVDPSGLFVVLGVTITVVGCLLAIPLAMILVGGAMTAIEIAAYIPVHDQFERCKDSARRCAERTVASKPDAWKAADDLEKRLRREQIAAMGPMLGSTFEFLSGF
ncbi:MAG: RHS repeat-associated core domain-containing protein, partial [Coriobacteriia bacterium]|nr:RHS repeat-associated core domain-containing protein [Coriobacteriia bacterium]